MKTENQLELSEIKRVWIDDAHARFMARLFSIGTFSADDLRHYVEPPPEPNWIGCLMARLRNEGRIREVGRVRSNRPERNGAKISLWQTL